MSMTYNRTSSRGKWTIMQYLRDFDLMIAFAYALRESPQDLTESNLLSVLGKLQSQGVYTPTSKHPCKDAAKAEKNINTANFRIIQISWYMFGYYDKNQSNTHRQFVFSPLGNLLLDNIDDKLKAAKIFITMLFSLPFKQHFSHMNNSFNLYPYRLVFHLLCDQRLDGKIFADELFYLVFFVKSISASEYEDLVNDILEFRKMSSAEKLKLFKKNEGVIALSLQESKYFCGMLQSAGIVQWDIKKGTIGSLVQGEQTNRHAKKPTSRAYKLSYIKINSDVLPYVKKLLSKYPYTDIPYIEDELQGTFENDVVIRMYNFYPPELVDEIGLSGKTSDKIQKMLAVVKQIEPHASNEDGDKTGKNFEYILKDVFNLFCDVDAEKIGGSGNTDLECIYYPTPSSTLKFDVEAKSRKNRLLDVLPKRLEKHRAKIGSKYTIIIAPNYASGVLDDIADAPNIVLKSSVFSQYMAQYILSSAKKSTKFRISYTFLHHLACEHFGQDMTNALYSYIIKTFGHNIVPQPACAIEER